MLSMTVLEESIMRAIAVELNRLLETLDSEAGDRVECEVRNAMSLARPNNRSEPNEPITLSQIVIHQSQSSSEDAAESFANMTGARTISLNADEMLLFWNALNSPTPLSPTQKRLGAITRVEC